MLCADGVTPFDNGRQDSLLVVVLANLNLPADIRMKRENLVLLGITDKKPGNASLIYDLVVDDIEEMWRGVPCWDSSVDKQFVLRAMMVISLMDYPGLTEACGQNNESTFASCCKCSMQGITVASLGGLQGDVKYSMHGHHQGRDAGKHNIEVERYTDESLREKADDIEVERAQRFPSKP